MKKEKKKLLTGESAYLNMACYLALNNPELLDNLFNGNMLVPSLDGKGKMSKSGQNLKAVIWLNNSREEVRKKIAKISSTPENWHIFLFFYYNFALKNRLQKERFVEKVTKKLRNDINNIEISG
jgi:hypothetical protein